MYKNLKKVMKFCLYSTILRFNPRIYLKHAMSSHYRACPDNLDPRVRLSVTPEDDKSRGRRLRVTPEDDKSRGRRLRVTPEDDESRGKMLLDINNVI